jgi:hypothetical protein
LQTRVLKPPSIHSEVLKRRSPVRSAPFMVCLALVGAISAVAVPIRSATLANAQAVSQAPSTSQVQNNATAGPPRPGASNDPPDPEGVRRLALAQVYMRAAHWDKAADAYARAAMSTNSQVARDGAAGLAQALREKDAAPLGLRARLSEPYAHWWLLDYVVYCILVTLLITVLPVWSWISANLFGPVLRFVAKRDRYQAPWRVSLAGSAGEAERSAAFDEFLVTYEVLQHDQSGDGLASVGPPSGKFFTPYSLADLVGSDLVVRGVDVSRIAEFVQKIAFHFSYNFEVRVDTYQKHPYLSASLRWGGRQDRYWQIPVLGENHLDCYREAGRQLAFSVFGDPLVQQ